VGNKSTIKEDLVSEIFIISNANETLFRTWEDFGFGWTSDRNKALWFARRSDAERIRAEDEDAWKILRYDEAGWLIERADSEPSAPKYWCVGWTSNHAQAIRFARKEDAEMVAQRMMKGVAVRICEHGWS